MKFRIIRRCREPEPLPSVLSREVEEEIKSIKLPDRESVKQRIRERIKDEEVRNAIEQILDSMYSMPADSEFMDFYRREAYRYRIHRRKSALTDYTALMTLAFIAYCKDKVYGDKSLEEIAEEEAKKEKEGRTRDSRELGSCAIIIELMNALKGKYSGASNLSIKDIVKFSYKWKKETDKLKHMWRRIEREWCEW